MEEDESLEEDMMNVEHSDEMSVKDVWDSDEGMMINVNGDVGEEWLMGLT